MSNTRKRRMNRFIPSDWTRDREKEGKKLSKGREVEKMEKQVR